jgi:coenzyme F420-dependent glucose-6-phosphate dehydrogenase
VLHTHPGRRPPIYVSAFGPRAARVAGRYGDGMWTLADPEQAPALIETYREAARQAGREPGEIVLQAMFSWAPDDELALEGARVWKGAQPPEFYTDDWHDPGAMYRRGEEQVSDDEFREGALISSDPDVHVRKIRELLALGPTILALNNCSGHDPRAAIRVYGEQVLPKLRGA